MDTRLFNYFMVVAEEKNLGRAAIRLHITQPALTRKIQTLEEKFGTQLFTRTAAGMVTTPAGEALLRRARNVMTEIGLAKSETLSADRKHLARLDVGIYGSAIFNIIPHILDEFSRENPTVELVLHSARANQQVESLRLGKILIAFDRFFPEEPDLIRELIFEESPCIALHKKHPLACNAVIELNELRDEIFIGGHEKFSEIYLLHTYGFLPNFGQKVDDVLTAVALVGCGFGICFVPPSLQELHIPNVVYLPLLDGPNFSFNLHCAYRKDERSPLLNTILETVRAYRARSH